MRLKEEKIDNIAKKILAALNSNQNINIVAAEDKIIHEIKTIFLKDFKREDELDEEINQKLKANMDKIQRENLNYNELFRKAKNQVAKERKIII